MIFRFSWGAEPFQKDFFVGNDPKFMLYYLSLYLSFTAAKAFGWSPKEKCAGVQEIW